MEGGREVRGRDACAGVRVRAGTGDVWSATRRSCDRAPSRRRRRSRERAIVLYRCSPSAPAKIVRYSVFVEGKRCVLFAPPDGHSN